MLSTRGRKAKFEVVLQELGADETVNYREQDFADVYRDKPFDFIFDSVGGKLIPLCIVFE